MGSELGPMGWRVGGTGNAIYHDNEFMGFMRTAELAELVVAMFTGTEVRFRSLPGHGPSPVFTAWGGELCLCGAQWLRESWRCTDPEARS